MRKIRINYTECWKGFVEDHFCREAMLLPVIPRIEVYKKRLQSTTGDFEGLAEFFTIDEIFLLVAQKFCREKLYDLDLMSICDCKGLGQRLIRVDDEGDMIDDPHHGFFSQRLDLLR